MKQGQNTTNTPERQGVYYFFAVLRAIVTVSTGIALLLILANYIPGMMQTRGIMIASMMGIGLYLFDENVGQIIRSVTP